MIKIIGSVHRITYASAMTRSSPVNQKPKHGRLRLGVEIQLALAVALSMVMAKVVLVIHEWGPPEIDHSYAISVMILMPMTLVITLAIILAHRSRTARANRSEAHIESSVLLQVFWLSMLMFWLITTLVSYVF